MQLRQDIFSERFDSFSGNDLVAYNSLNDDLFKQFKES
jgi:hypothetical protein